MIRALVLFSGGLDSILTIKLLKEQEIKVTGLSFDSYFFDTAESKKSAKQLGIDLITKDISKLQLEVVKNPQYGYGSALNPCIDCHGLMFRIAGKIAQQDGYDIVATGEVLSQRPFSQNKEALKKVAKLASVEILRPLSAKLLPETTYEKKGFVNRKKLLDISGKSRQRQLKLVKRYGVKYFPSPAGGCRLTEKEFGKKVSQLLKNDGQDRELDKVDFELLRIGRHFWIDMEKYIDTNNNKSQSIDKENKRGNYKVHVALGKNHEENKQLKKSAKKGGILVELEEIMGPIALVFKKNRINLERNTKLLNEVKKLVLERTKNKNKDINKADWIIKMV